MLFGRSRDRREWFGKVGEQVQQASSSIGRAAVSKTAGWGFDSLLACHLSGKRLNMTENVQQVESGGALDSLKLLLALGAIIGGLVAYYMTPELALALRVLMVLGGIIVCFAIGLTSHKGQQLWRFVQGSRVEIRKVVWPTRQETTQITILVFVFTALLGIFFWALDAGLLWATRAATGQI